MIMKNIIKYTQLLYCNMMKKNIYWIPFIFLILQSGIIFAQQDVKQKEYPIKHNHFSAVKISDSFWSNRLCVNEQVTIPDVIDKCETSGRIQNFAVTAGLIPGKFIGGASWDDSDVFKTLEGAAHQYAATKNEKLLQRMDSIIALVAAAQEPDGYLVTAMQINKEKNLPWNIRSPRFSYMIWSHELYNFGHLYEGAVAHYRATGKRTFLDVAIKNADLLVQTFLTGDSLNTSVDGHPELKIGLVKLWQITGKEEYLALAKRMMELRGNSSAHPLMLSYDEGRNPHFFMDYLPIKQYDKAYGHAVRALYLYSSMTDLGVYLNDREYIDALDKVWNNMVTKKMYITGGVGSRHKGEAFGEDYELPNATAYCETCSSIANILWQDRMFCSQGDAKYINVLERILYNSFLAGLSLSGKEYNYVNPLESDGEYKYNKGANARQPWFETSCCPTNISRFLPQLSSMIYAYNKNDIYVNLFVGSKTSIPLKKGNVKIEQKTSYPWQGDIVLSINPENKSHFAIHVRIPSWIGETPMPAGDIYRYADSNSKNYILSVNGKNVSCTQKKGYAIIEREWVKGDKISLNLMMNTRLVSSNSIIENYRNKAVVERGPIVYCIEQWDNSQMDSTELNIAKQFYYSYDASLLGGIGTLKNENLFLIPYYSWGNRGANKMKVWIPFKD